MAIRSRYPLVFALGALFAAGCDGVDDPLGSEAGQPAARPDDGRASEGDPTKDSYIVVLRQDGPDVAERIGRLKARHGQFSEDRVYRRTLQGFSARLPKGQMARLAADPDVDFIERDIEVRAVGQLTPWGIADIGMPSPSPFVGDKTVAGVRIYILDTGIQPYHPDLQVRAGINFSSRKSDWSDRNGHGTHVAGTAAARDNGTHVVGVAPGAPLYAVKVLGDNGSGSLSNVIAGVEWVANEKTMDAKIVNMSLSAFSGTGLTSLDVAIRNAIKAGIVFAVAAGNNSRNASLYCPAHLPEAITVGAYATGSTFAGFSNYGEVVDILAPGVSITSTWIRSSTATISGTSMAAPHVAGAAALYLSKHPGASPEDVRNALVLTLARKDAIAGEPDGTTDDALNIAALY